MINDLKNQPDLAYNSSSFQSNMRSEMSEIFKVKNNISIWQRDIGNLILESSKNILSSNPNLEFSKIVKPDNVEKTLSENIDSSKESDYLFKDISKVVNIFCDLFSVDSAWLRLDAVYGPMCPRFHVDNVKCRLVTTYVGPATQWLPNDIIDRSKLGHGNEGKSDEISGLYLKESDVNQLAIGHIALLKGESWDGNKGHGLVHRSPEQEGEYKRLYMTIDFTDLYFKIFRNRLEL